ncbi:hypothetical protein D3P09_02600 [Paenibacillus pinisoli]|uniref:Fibronectin type-III domain-containing protein n=1 Tax=Paenibacillus pinisoli TaxID=1276110 RepID=A0A3A6PIG3_9BACL|nr:hypothetical protein [Paenibacillus pinisoli]RJX40925.1 hypothetical protein D3P09_02600 [Paenibacillus pinisoli]
MLKTNRKGLLKRRSFSFSLIFILILSLSMSLVSAGSVETEVKNLAPFVDFEVKDKKKVDVIVDVGNTKYKKNEVQSRVKEFLIPALQASGVDYNVVVDESNEGHNAIYFSGNNEQPGGHPYDLYKYDMITEEVTRINNNALIHNSSIHYALPNDLIMYSRNGGVGALDLQSKLYSGIANTSNSDGAWVVAPDGNLYVFVGGHYFWQGTYRINWQNPIIDPNASAPVNFPDNERISTDAPGTATTHLIMGKNNHFYERIFYAGVTTGLSVTKNYGTPNAKYISLGSEVHKAMELSSDGLFFYSFKTPVWGTSTYDIYVYNQEDDSKTLILPKVPNGYDFRALEDGRLLLVTAEAPSYDRKYFIMEDVYDPSSLRPLSAPILTDPKFKNSITLHHAQGSNILYSITNAEPRFRMFNVDTGVDKEIANFRPLNVIRYPHWYNPNTRTMQDIIEAAPLRSDAEKIYVRLDDISINALERPEKMGEIAALLAQHNMAFIGLGTTSNQDQIYRLLENISHNGTFLSNGNLKTAFSDLSNFITDRKEVNLHVVIGDTSYTEQEIRDQFNQRLTDLRSANIRVNMQVIKADKENLQELLYLAHWDYNKNNYIVYIHDQPMPELEDELVYDDTIVTLKEYSSHFIGLGNTTNRTTLNNIVASNNSLGAFYDNSNLPSAVTTTMNYIKDTAITNVKKLTNYIVLNADPTTGEYSSEITVQTYYEDAESDPKRTERWRTTHDPNIYENNMGVLEGTGQYALEPIKYFTKVGMYEIVAQAQDNPSANPQFDEYRQWSRDSLSRMVVYVHRAPVADLKAIVDQSRKLTVTDLSYDLDRYSYPDRGIIQKIWKWKRVDDAIWTEGKAPSVLEPNTDYLISLRVKDLDGAWSPETIRFVSTNPFNRPPVALFTIDNKTISLTGDATFTDQSYDPDNDPIGQRVWTVRKDNVQLYQGANKPSGELIKQYAAQQGLPALGKYSISLRVQDIPRIADPLWSNMYTDFLDIVNYPPIAQFDPLEQTYRDDLNMAINRTVNPDQDGDPVSYQWTLMYGSKEFAMGSTKDLSFRIRDRGLGKAAVGTWMLQLKASDPHGASTYQTHTFDVLNHVPVSTITSGTWIGYIYEPYTYTSARTDMDTEDVTSLKSYWKLTAPDGQIQTFDKQNISITFDEKGRYLLENWVVDQLGAVSEIDSREINIVNQKPIPGFTIMSTPAFIDTIVKITSTATDMDGYIDKHQYFVKPPNGTQTAYTQLADFERVFATIGIWQIRQIVTDNDGATAEITQSLMVHNRPPSVNITTPSGITSATATEFGTLTPRIIWQMSDPDGHTGQRYRLLIKRDTGALVYDSNSVTSSRNYHDIPASAGLVENVRYRAEVQVYDGYDWSPYSTPKYFVITLNRPPEADFNWSPNPVYEGDTVTFRSIVSDPDRDTLSVMYEITNPQGNRSTYTYNLSYPYPDTAPTVRMQMTGNWLVKMTVSDGKAPPVVVSKTVDVNALGITASVKHTDDWEKNRLAWNKNRPGELRDELIFWAGERFVLNAGTTDTGSSNTKATKVDVTAVKIGSTSLGSRNAVTWSGYLGNDNADIKLENLSNGEYLFIFVATYSNGVKKEATVTVKIRGNWTDYFKLHQNW